MGSHRRVFSKGERLDFCLNKRKDKERRKEEGAREKDGGGGYLVNHELGNQSWTEEDGLGDANGESGDFVAWLSTGRESGVRESKAHLMDSSHTMAFSSLLLHC